MQCKDCNTKNSVTINNKFFCADCGNKVNATPNAAKTAAAKPFVSNNLLDLSKLQPKAAPQAAPSSQTPSSPSPDPKPAAPKPSPARNQETTDEPLQPETPAQEPVENRIQKRSAKHAKRLEKSTQIGRSSQINKFPSRVATVAAAATPPPGEVEAPETPQAPTPQPEAVEAPTAPPISPHVTDLRNKQTAAQPAKPVITPPAKPELTQQPPQGVPESPTPPRQPAPQPTPTPPSTEPTPVPAPEPAPVPETAPQSEPPTTSMKPEQDYHVKSDPRQNTAEAVLEAVEQSKLHRQELEQNKVKVKKKRLSPSQLIKPLAGLMKPGNRASSLLVGGLALLVLGGYITYLNLPNLGLRVAASRAGISAQMPHYTPSGYDFSGPIAYSPGVITVNFADRSGETITVNQRKTDWDSETLLASFVTKEAENYLTFQEKGLKIYLYNDTNATWVNKGIWYSIEATGSINPEQLIRMASSL